MCLASAESSSAQPLIYLLTLAFPGSQLQDRRGRVGGGHPGGVQQVGRPLGGPPAQVPRGGRADRRRQEDEEDDVGAVLELPPAILQVPLHRLKSK